MEEPVEERSGDHRGTEDLSPSRESPCCISRQDRLAAETLGHGNEELGALERVSRRKGRPTAGAPAVTTPVARVAMR
jgi:hypothetical protein